MQFIYNHCVFAQPGNWRDQLQAEDGSEQFRNRGSAIQTANRKLVEAMNRIELGELVNLFCLFVYLYFFFFF
jgi:hypothetical protein